MKKCPFCAEEIQDAAIYCMHCHRSVVDDETQKSPSNLNATVSDNNHATTELSSRKSKNGYSVIIVIGLLGLVAILTNPNLEKHKEVVKFKLRADIQKPMIQTNSNTTDEGSRAGEVLGVMIGGVLIDRFIDNVVSSDSYVFFSVTKLTWKGESKVIGIGAFGNIFLHGLMDTARDVLAKETGAKDVSGLFKGKLRSLPEAELSIGSVKDMLKDKGFFEVDYNKTASGFSNEYELQSEGEVVYDHASGLTWQRSGSSMSEWMSFNDAKEYVSRLNRERFAGYRDWRLPTLEEAMSLMEPIKMNKAEMFGDLYIDPKVGKQWAIWTSDLYSASSGWVVDFSFGGCSFYAFDYVTSVRAVR